MAMPEPSLKSRALRLLAAREHSRAELLRKLKSHELEDGTLEKMLDELQAKGFIHEQRVVDSVLHRRAAKLGAARIRQELTAKGLPQQAIRDAVAVLQATELERAREVWRKKFGAPPADASERGKQQRFLAARGFAAEAIRRVVSGSSED